MCRRQAFELSDRRWRYDVDVLVTSIAEELDQSSNAAAAADAHDLDLGETEEYPPDSVREPEPVAAVQPAPPPVERSTAPPPRARSRPPRSQRVWWLLAGLVGVAVIIGAVVVLAGSNDSDSGASDGSTRSRPRPRQDQSRRITDERQDLIAALNDIEVPTSLAQGQDLVDLLRAAVQESINSHVTWRAWMSGPYATVYAARCTQSEVTPDVTDAFDRAGEAKDAFLTKYNPAAKQYGLRSDWVSTDF